MQLLTATVTSADNAEADDEPAVTARSSKYCLVLEIFGRMQWFRRRLALHVLSLAFDTGLTIRERPPTLQSVHSNYSPLMLLNVSRNSSVGRALD